MGVAQKFFNWFAGSRGGLFVSNNGSGSGDGSSAGNSMSLAAFINYTIQDGDRILFNRGETY